MYQLRGYQERLISQVYASWDSGNRSVMLQLPTGAGKTIIFAAIIAKFLKQGRKAMIIAHRRELISQATEKIQTVTKNKPSIILSGEKRNIKNSIHVASIQTLIGLDQKPQVDLLVFDEAHHTTSKSYISIIEEYPDALILGVTATPLRMDGQGFKNLYEDLVIGPSVADLIKEEYLSKFRLFAAISKIKTRGISVTGGDFNLKELNQAVAEADITGDLVPTWRKYAEGKKTILFAVDVAHSKECAKAFNDAGIKAEHIDGQISPIERDAIINRFRNGATLVLCNCNIVSEGFDVPNIEAVQCVRPTLSLVFYLQMFGRALRPAENKEYAILIDHTHNWGNHGLPDINREYSLEPKSLQQSIFTQECPNCGHIFLPPRNEINNPKQYGFYKNNQLSIHETTCPNCQHIFQFYLGVGKEREPRQLTLDLLEEYGQIKEIISLSATKSLNISLLKYSIEQRVEIKHIRNKKSYRMSQKTVNLTKMLRQPALVYFYGTSLRFPDTTKQLYFDYLYDGIAVLEIHIDEIKCRFIIANFDINNVKPNYDTLNLLVLHQIIQHKDIDSIVKKIKNTICYAIFYEKKGQKMYEKFRNKDSEEKALLQSIKEACNSSYPDKNILVQELQRLLKDVRDEIAKVQPFAKSALDRKTELEELIKFNNDFYQQGNKEY